MAKEKKTKKKEGEYQKYLKEKKEAPVKGRPPIIANEADDGLAQKSKDHKRRNLIARYGIEKVEQMKAEEKERKEKLAARG